MPEDNKKTPDFNAWLLAWELGYTIAIPIVVFALIGRMADKYFQSSPWFLLFGIVVSIVMSTVLVYKKVARLL